ncbi:MAG: phosphoribosyl transferase [Betaproteobacteria bacterium RIFCSPLOWO2_12_FULL_62_13b]|nr:MAG: phosphoribosyl transferase [Betaproteobacteria bacterium RIFCSPLOWO2_12_FULL_62_13b]
MFVDRVDAAQRLAKALAPYRGQHPLVLAIPRGSVPMGKIIAAALDGELDVVLVRKLRAPFSPEFAVGAIDESGRVYVAPDARAAGADEAYLVGERETQLALLRQRRAQYTPARAPIDPAARVAIVIDDGLATGATMIAALHSVRSKQPRRLICAVPVAAPQSLAAVAPYADEVVCLQAPVDFQAVGQFYRSFPQVEDEVVVATLAESRVAAGTIKDP